MFLYTDSPQSAAECLAAIQACSSQRKFHYLTKLVLPEFTRFYGDATISRASKLRVLSALAELHGSSPLLVAPIGNLLVEQLDAITGSMPLTRLSLF